ncbi:cadherin-like protein 26 [Anomaloglossus baeobatrachus]|uniref:cadherin-like protein 26 n=1 Tax=Anomaloglossus baeobatrachus TaxID=238106 RepID=UPI003F4F5E68
MKTLYPLLILLLVVAITSLGERPKRVVQKRVKRHVDTADSLRPLRRSKRRWVLTTIVLEENDPGPFPKYAGDLFNDRSDNFSIQYLISGPGVDKPPEEGLFQVNHHTGRVYVNRPIDREKTALFVIQFDVANKATGEIVDKSLIFNVEVKDLNDNAPIFLNSTYDVLVKETANLDSPVLTVTATDHDKEDTLNSKVNYYLVNQIPDLPNVKFSVDATTGLIRGKGCLNYEAANIIRLIVGARDSGTEPLASTTTVILRLEDGNTNMPVFLSNNYEVTVNEGIVKNDVFRIKVEDKDAPKTPAWRAKYKILSGNEKDNYDLTTDPDTNEGILNIISPLDFEATASKTIVVSVENEEPFYACKNGKLKVEKNVVRSNATINVNVIDSNDPPIFFPASKTIREKEGVKPGTVLGTLNATDPDKVPNKIRYKIAEDPAGWVTIDENTGVLTTTQVLDRESPYVNQTLYKVVVYAVDDGDPPATGTGTVLLYVSDVNDNTPQLVEPFFQRCEKENKMPIIIEATDKDMDPYAGPFKFEVAPDHSRSVKEVWDIKQNSDKSVEILMRQSLPKGNYSIPLEIYDRQGSYSEQVLNIRVCSCPDGGGCEKLDPASHNMGGGAIAAIIGALFLFLLALCLLMCFLCGAGGKNLRKIPGNDEGNQTLIHYNEEGGSVLSQASPAVLMSNGNGNLDLGIKDKDAVGRTLSSTLQRAQYPSWETNGVGRSPVGRAPHQSWETDGVGRSPVGRAPHQSWEADGAGLLRSASKRTRQNQTWAQGNQTMQSQSGTWHQNGKYVRSGSIKNRYDNMFVEKIGEMLTQRLQGINGDDEISSYKPRTYAYEGELERIESMDSITFPDNINDFKFLNDFDPKFSKLEEICKK